MEYVISDFRNERMDGTEQFLVAHILINKWLKFSLRNTKDLSFRLSVENSGLYPLKNLLAYNIRVLSAGPLHMA